MVAMYCGQCRMLRPVDKAGFTFPLIYAYRVDPYQFLARIRIIKFAELLVLKEYDMTCLTKLSKAVIIDRGARCANCEQRMSSSKERNV